MKSRYSAAKYFIWLLIPALVIVFSITSQVSAQVIPPFYGAGSFYYYNPFLNGYNPYFAYPAIPPLAPTAPLLFPPSPPFSPFVPYVASLPATASRAGAATIILTSAAPVTTAAAPLGTLSLTPSTLVFLILLATLAE